MYDVRVEPSCENVHSPGVYDCCVYSNIYNVVVLHLRQPWLLLLSQKKKDCPQKKFFRNYGFISEFVFLCLLVLSLQSRCCVSNVASSSIS